jgi:hypothetical protein
MSLLRRSRTALQSFKSGIKRLDPGVTGTSQQKTSITTSKTGILTHATLFATTAAMATPYKIELDVKHKAAWQVPGLTEESAKKTSELLQRNHEDHHIFFNKEGFHVRPFSPTLSTIAEHENRTTSSTTSSLPTP